MHPSVEETRRFHGERVEARQAERNQPQQRPWDGTASHARVQNAERVRVSERIVNAALAHIILGLPLPSHEILSAGNEPGFMRFWDKLNEQLLSSGQPSALYGQAKEAYKGGPTPDGALTFIGKKWADVRAVPAAPVEGKKAYHGEFREIEADGGIVWRCVANSYGRIAYTSAEAALGGALHAKEHMHRHSKS